jgi:hypothetical protein
MKSKMGRPTLSDSGAKEIIKTQRYGEDDSKLTSLAAEKAGQGESTFIRNAAVEKAKTNRWGKCKFSKAELDGQHIQFTLHSLKGVTAGIGKISAWENNKGRISVDIIIETLVAPNRIEGWKIWIDANGVERIELNPDQQRAKFILLA